MTKTKRIAYFVHSLREAGTSAQAITFCEAASKIGYDVELVVTRKSGVFLDICQGKQIKVKCLTKTNFLSGLQSIFALALYIKNQKPDVVISGAKRINMIALAAHMIALKPSKLVLTLTNNLKQKNEASGKERWISTYFTKHLYKLADKTIVLTPQMMDELISGGFPKNKLNYIHPPIDIERIREMSDKYLGHLWLSELKDSRKIPVIVAAGRLSKQKNYELLLQSFAKATKIKPMRLIVLGTGKQKKTRLLNHLVISLGISESVDFIGFQPNPYTYIAKANVFALSSHWEGYGIVLSEALACGTTIVATDCPHGPRHILDGNNFGYLIPPNDSEQFAQALLEAASSPICPKKLNLRAENFDLASSMNKYNGAITELF